LTDIFQDDLLTFTAYYMYIILYVINTKGFFMWQQTHRCFYEGISKKEIWRLWKDIDNWPRWHTDLESCRLIGDFKVGSHFFLKPKGMKAVKIQLVDIKEEYEFTDCTSFFGAKMYDTHRVEEQKGGLLLTNHLVVKGPLTKLWVRLVARHVAESVPEEVRSLVDLAKSDY
tara:strand:+ start:2540 stop:3052 length:513 start_codon:yes stop_codon:yes gene_type:complete